MCLFLTGPYYDNDIKAKFDDAEFIEFDDYPITVTDHDVSSWNELAFTLKSYIAADQPQPVDNGVTDENGVVSFPNTVERLRPGLYLVS